MTVGKAVGIISNILEAPFTRDEKLEAIRIVSEMKMPEYKSAIKKEATQQVFKWMVNEMEVKKDA